MYKSCLSALRHLQALRECGASILHVTEEVRGSWALDSEWSGRSPLCHQVLQSVSAVAGDNREVLWQVNPKVAVQSLGPHLVPSQWKNAQARLHTVTAAASALGALVTALDLGSESTHDHLMV